MNFRKTLNALNEVNALFKEETFSLPIENPKLVKEVTFLKKGLAVQIAIGLRKRNYR